LSNHVDEMKRIKRPSYQRRGKGVKKEQARSRVQQSGGKGPHRGFKNEKGQHVRKGHYRPCGRKLLRGSGGNRLMQEGKKR